MGEGKRRGKVVYQSITRRVLTDMALDASELQPKG